MSMNGFAIVFLLVNAVALLRLPRRWAPLPLLVGTCYMTLGQGIDLGPFTFTVIRMLILVGVVRVVARGEQFSGKVNGLDKLISVFAGWALISSAFHENPLSALVFRLGLVYNICGTYFLLRVFCQSLEDVARLLRITAILLVPIALEMLSEKVTMHNFFSAFGGVAASPAIRKGHIRAQGPFAHPILAGTVGAVCLPLMISLWQQHRKEAIVGIFACLAIVFCSASSGPIMSALAAIGAVYMWRYRHRMRLVRWLAVLGYLGLDLVMKAPPYYLMDRIDLSGGSTGWYRARLIQSAFEHLNEWWLAGTDYTRNWMPTGRVPWSPDQTDITNHYLHFGVLGGLPLMLLFIFILVKGFSFVGQTLQYKTKLSSEHQFMVWTLGASLFAQAATCVSVSYFDQSFVFLYLTLAAIGSTFSCSRQAQEGAGSISSGK